MTDASPVATTPFCAQCGEESLNLTPYRHESTPARRATPRYCKRCLPRDWGKLVQTREPQPLPEPPTPDRPHRSFPARFTCPPYTPVVSFVWDIPNVLHDAVSDMKRGQRIGPVPWWARREWRMAAARDRD